MKWITRETKLLLYISTRIIYLQEWPFGVNLFILTVLDNIILTFVVALKFTYTYFHFFILGNWPITVRRIRKGHLIISLIMKFHWLWNLIVIIEFELLLIFEFRILCLQELFQYETSMLFIYNFLIKSGFSALESWQRL